MSTSSTANAHIKAHDQGLSSPSTCIQVAAAVEREVIDGVVARFKWIS